jgi:hypothetical protein
MKIFQRNDKVYVKLGDNQIAAIVLEVSPSSDSQADLVWLRIAVRNPYFKGQWIITDYPEPVWSTALTVRKSSPPIPGLDT